MAKQVAGLLGIDKVMFNLNKELRKMTKAGNKGLILASVVIRRDMDLRPPKIPVDLGNLRASWFTTTGKAFPISGGNFTGKDSGKMSGDHSKAKAQSSSKANSKPWPILVMGFSAGYGVFVHEAKQTGFKRSGSGPKFFESSVKRNHKVVLQIIANEIKTRR